MIVFLFACIQPNPPSQLDTLRYIARCKCVLMSRLAHLLWAYTSESSHFVSMQVSETWGGGKLEGLTVIHNTRNMIESSEALIGVKEMNSCNQCLGQPYPSTSNHISLEPWKSSHRNGMLLDGSRAKLMEAQWHSCEHWLALSLMVTMGVCAGKGARQSN